MNGDSNWRLKMSGDSNWRFGMNEDSNCRSDGNIKKFDGRVVFPNSKGETKKKTRWSEGVDGISVLIENGIFAVVWENRFDETRWVIYNLSGKCIDGESRHTDEAKKTVIRKIKKGFA